jgi:hypothetical protein
MKRKSSSLEEEGDDERLEQKHEQDSKRTRWNENTLQNKDAESAQLCLSSSDTLLLEQPHLDSTNVNSYIKTNTNTSSSSIPTNTNTSSSNPPCMTTKTNTSSSNPPCMTTNASSSNPPCMTTNTSSSNRCPSSSANVIIRLENSEHFTNFIRYMLSFSDDEEDMLEPFNHTEEDNRTDEENHTDEDIYNHTEEDNYIENREEMVRDNQAKDEVEIEFKEEDLEVEDEEDEEEEEDEEGKEEEEEEDEEDDMNISWIELERLYMLRRWMSLLFDEMQRHSSTDLPDNQQPLTEEQIQHLDKENCNGKEDENDERNLPNMCSICYESLQVPFLYRLPCQHDFHRSCVIPWLQQQGSCPLCRHHHFSH